MNAGIDTSVVLRLLTGTPEDLAQSALTELQKRITHGDTLFVSELSTPNLSTANPGFVDRLIHAEYRRYAGEMLTFEKAAGRLPGTRVLVGE